MRSATRYMKQYGTSYYYATLFFPKNIKNDVITLYKFVRIPDLVVDNKTTTPESAKAELQEMQEHWLQCYKTHNTTD